MRSTVHRKGNHMFRLVDKMLSSIIHDDAVTAAIDYAGQTGELLVSIDTALSYMDSGEYNDAKRVLLDVINKHGEGIQDLLDHYYSTVVVLVEDDNPIPTGELDPRD